MARFPFKGRVEKVYNTSSFRTVNLRKSAKFFISESGEKFYTQTGRVYGNQHGAEQLDITSVVERDGVKGDSTPHEKA